MWKARIAKFLPPDSITYAETAKAGSFSQLSIFSCVVEGYHYHGYAGPNSFV